MNNLNSDG